MFTLEQVTSQEGEESASASTSASASAATTARRTPGARPVWYWRASHVGADQWKPFAEAQCAALEAAMRAGDTNLVDIDDMRCVDLKTMRQQRKDNPSRYRQVRRDGPDAG